MLDLARGRVWTGAQALDLGLVDNLGGYGEARAAVRDLLALEADAPLRWKSFPEPGGWRELLGGRDDSPVTVLVDELAPVLESLRQAGVFRSCGELEVRPPRIR